MNASHSTVPVSAAPYSGFRLRAYDRFVLDFTSPYAWRFPRQEIAELYRQECTPIHAEVGVGTGYFLETPGVVWDDLTLIDANPATLTHATARLADAHVTPRRYVADILRGDNLPPRRYTSVAANYLVHCLPGPMKAKDAAIANLAALTADDGHLFGATVLADSPHNRLGRVVMAACNRVGAFGNADDTEAGLVDLLSAHFDDVSVSRGSGGIVAIFRASSPRRAAA